MIARSVLPFMVILALSGCDNGTANTGPGGVSSEDAAALDKAADKLDAEAAGQTENR